MERTKAGPVEGEPVLYVDSLKNEHHAIVTANWGLPENPTPALNLVMVNDNPAQTDSYGRQIARQTSVVHVSSNSAGANCWKRVGE